MKKVLKYIGFGIVLLFALVIILGNIGNILVSKNERNGELLQKAARSST